MTAAAAAGERPRFLGINEMQKALREAGTQLRETHERNERQLQVVGDGRGVEAVDTRKRLQRLRDGDCCCRLASRDLREGMYARADARR